MQVGDFHAWELDIVPDAQSGAPRRGITNGYGYSYGGMPRVPMPAQPEP